MRNIIELQLKLAKRTQQNNIIYVALIIFSLAITSFFWLVVLVLFKEDFLQSTLSDKVVGLNFGFILIFFFDVLFFSRILESYAFSEYKTYLLFPFSKVKIYLIHLISVIYNVRAFLYLCNMFILMGVFFVTYKVRADYWLPLIGLILMVYLLTTSLFLSIIYLKTLSDFIYNINVMHVIMGLLVPVYLLILTGNYQIISDIPILRTFSKILLSVISSPSLELMNYGLIAAILLLLNFANYLFLKRRYLMIR